MILQEHFKLYNGVHIPKLGLGTWMINNKNVVQAVQDALQLGYRHIDTAQAYRNQVGIAHAIQRSSIARDEIFITHKLAAGIKSYKKAVQAIDQSLHKMQLDHLDLMLIHSPQPWTKFGTAERYFEGNLEVWQALIDAYYAGKLRAIGVSNFQQNDLKNLIDNSALTPMVNQVLAHIGNTPFELIEYCQTHQILVEAYAPIAHGQLLKHDLVNAMAEKYAVSVPQLSIRYALQLGLLPLPKTTHPTRMQHNAEVDFQIAEADLNSLKHIEKIQDYGRDSFMPVFGGKLSFTALLSALFHR